jgi:WD40 repeat protein
MRVLQVGGSVTQLRFLPAGRRLLVVTESPERTVAFDVWTLPDGGRVRLQLPRLQLRADDWWHVGHGNSAVVHPSGDWCHVACGRLFSFHTADGTPRPAPGDVEASQVVQSPDGGRLLAARVISGSTDNRLYALTAHAAGGSVAWEKTVPYGFRQVAAFLPDGERFVTIDSHVRIRTFATDDEQAAVRYPAGHASQPQLAPDGRHLGVIGYGSMYLFDTATLDRPRRIGGTRTFGNFVSFAFHPDGRSLAVIHGGPTLLKVYDLATLRLDRTYRWKLGPLGAVTFSPDEMQGAVGSRDGRVLLWDVDQ